MMCITKNYWYKFLSLIVLFLISSNLVIADDDDVKKALAIGAGVAVGGAIIYSIFGGDDICFRPDGKCNSKQEDRHEAFHEYMEDKIDDLSSKAAIKACSSPQEMYKLISEFGFEFAKGGATWLWVSASGDLSEEAFDSAGDNVSAAIDLVKLITAQKSENNCT